MRGEGGEQDLLSLLAQFWSLSVVHGFGSHQAQSAVVMRRVVPAHKLLCPLPRVLHAPETHRTARAIFERPKVHFGVRIVVARLKSLNIVRRAHPQSIVATAIAGA